MKIYLMTKTNLARSLALALLGGALTGCGVGVEDDSVPPPQYDVDDPAKHEELYAPMAFEFKDVKDSPIETVGTSELYGYAQVAGIPFDQIAVPVWVEGMGAQLTTAIYTYDPVEDKAIYICDESNWQDANTEQATDETGAPLVDEAGNPVYTSEPEKLMLNGLKHVCVRIDPTTEHAPATYSDKATLTLYMGDSSRTILKFDEQGNPVQAVDDNGEPVWEVDENGEPILENGEKVPVQATVPSVVSDEFSVDIEERDVVPAPLAFTRNGMDIWDLAPEESEVCSDPLAITDINDKVALASADGTFRVNGVDASDGTFVVENDELELCLTTPAGQAVPAEAGLTVSALLNTDDPTDPADPNYVAPEEVATASFKVTTHPGDLPPIVDIQFPPQNSATLKSELAARGSYFIDPRLVEDGATLKSLTINGNDVSTPETGAVAADWTYDLTGLVEGENAFELVAVANTNSGEKTISHTITVTKVADFEGAFPTSNHLEYGMLADVSYDEAGYRLIVLDNGQDKVHQIDLATGVESEFVDLKATLDNIDSGINPNARGLEVDPINKRVIVSEIQKDKLYQFKLSNPSASGNYGTFAAKNGVATREPGGQNASDLRDPAQLALHPGTPASGPYVIVANSQSINAAGNSGVPKVNLDTGLRNQAVKGDGSMNFKGWAVDVYDDGDVDEEGNKVGANDPIFWLSNYNELYKLSLTTSVGSTLASSYEVSKDLTPLLETPAMTSNTKFQPRSIAIDDEKGILLATNLEATGEANLIAIELTSGNYERSVFADNSDATNAPLEHMATIYEHPSLGYYIAVINKAGNDSGTASYNALLAIDKETGDRVVLAKDASAAP